MSTGQFEIGRIKLQIRSQHFYTNFVKDITPAEFLTLRHVHGPHAVTLLEITGHAVETRMSEDGKWLKRPLPTHALREKLDMKYKPKEVAKVFPGANAPLPFTFEEVGIKIGDPNMEEGVDENDGWESMSDVEVTSKNLPKGQQKAPVEDLLGASLEEKPAEKPAEEKKAASGKEPAKLTLDKAPAKKTAAG